MSKPNIIDIERGIDISIHTYQENVAKIRHEGFYVVFYGESTVPCAKCEGKCMGVCSSAPNGHPVNEWFDYEVCLQCLAVWTQIYTYEKVEDSPKSELSSEDRLALLSAMSNAELYLLQILIELIELVPAERKHEIERVVRKPI